MIATFVLIVLVALALWGLVATIVQLATDGYGRPEIASRNRRAERLPDSAQRIR